MSIQPNRVIARIIEQVDRADWPTLRSRVHLGADEWVRIYHSPALPRYATALHFWVHALRDELAAVGRRRDLVGAAGHALCRAESIEGWLADLESQGAIGSGGEADGLRREVADTKDAQLHLMLESPCRRSSVLDLRDAFVADFRNHGGGPSWRRTARRSG